MGQQQLLLIVLGVIIVGIAVVVGINVFTSSSQSSGRDLLISQLTNLGAKAQQHYRKPEALGGGGNDFGGFAVSAAEDTSAAGVFLAQTSVPSGATAVTASTTALTGAPTTIYIVGSGNEDGNDGSNPVKAYATVTATNITTTVLN